MSPPGLRLEQWGLSDPEGDGRSAQDPWGWSVDVLVFAFGGDGARTGECLEVSGSVCLHPWAGPLLPPPPTLSAVSEGRA